jgi:hypothetical protein
LQGVPETHAQGAEGGPPSGPFSLDDELAYGRWRAHKLAHYPHRVEEQIVPIARLGELDAAQRAEISAACRRANFALYRTDAETTPVMEDLRDFGESLGLVRFDRHLWALQMGIVALRREPGSGRGDYIPYTDRPLNWHTDGYYTPDAKVRGVIMHCVSPAAEGGANWLLDPEMVYIAMRDANPALIEALMQPDVMTIPENTLEPGAERPAVTGPVFSVSPADGTLHMRYTARTRSIEWKDDASTRAAVAFLEELMTPPVPYAFHVRLEAGEGIVCNNVLHNREGFRDEGPGGRQRLLWRARYRDRVADTS